MKARSGTGNQERSPKIRTKLCGTPTSAHAFCDHFPRSIARMTNIGIWQTDHKVPKIILRPTTNLSEITSIVVAGANLESKWQKLYTSFQAYHPGARRQAYYNYFPTLIRVDIPTL